MTETNGRLLVAWCKKEKDTVRVTYKNIDKTQAINLLKKTNN